MLARVITIIKNKKKVERSRVVPPGKLKEIQSQIRT